MPIEMWIVKRKKVKIPSYEKSQTQFESLLKV